MANENVIFLGIYRIPCIYFVNTLILILVIVNGSKLSELTNNMSMSQCAYGTFKHFLIRKNSKFEHY